MSLKRRLKASAYLLRRLVLKGEAQRFAPSPAPVVRPDAPPEDGAVDGVTGHVVRGWARRLSDVSHLVRVDIYDGDEFIGRAPCNLPRIDLVGAPGFHESGRHGFAFTLPETLRRLGGRLRLFAADSGLELTGSPLEVSPAPSGVPAVDTRETLSKVWYAGPPTGRVSSLAQIEEAYGERLSILTEVDPRTLDAGWPVTRVMSHYNARAHGGALDHHGREAYVALLTAAAAHFAPASAGLPMDRRQVKALAAPTGWLLTQRVRSNMLIDVFSQDRPDAAERDEAQAAALLVDFILEVLARRRLPVELLGDSARSFLKQGGDEGATRFETALRQIPAFCAPAGAAAARLAAEDLGLADFISGGGPVAQAEASPPPPLRPGVNIITGEYSESGLTVNARCSLAALTLLGMETHVSVARLSASAEHADPPRPPLSTTLLHMTPDDAVETILRLSAAERRARLIGFFMWESETLPEAHRLGAMLVDEIWTASRYCEAAFRRAAPATPVRVVGHAVRLAEPDPAFDARGWAGVGPDDFVFLFHFDAHSWISRKNPTGLVRAFRRAFPAGQSGVKLVIKVRRADDGDRAHWRGWWREFHEEAACDRRIVIVDGDLSHGEMSALTCAADAFVSLHRSEGFGYGLAEAMLAGKPLIATGYSGNLEFTLPEETLLIPAARRAIQPGEFLYGDATHIWGEPDLDAAAAAMQALHRDRDLARRLGLRGRERIARDFSVAALARRYAQALGIDPGGAAAAPSPILAD